MLKDESVLSETGITENDFIVCMVTKEAAKVIRSSSIFLTNFQPKPSTPASSTASPAPVSAAPASPAPAVASAAPPMSTPAPAPQAAAPPAVPRGTFFP